MSNLIKASQIAYSEAVRTIDMNARAEDFQQEFVDKYISDSLAVRQAELEEVSKKLETERVLTPEDVDFTPGLYMEQISLNPEDEENETVSLENRLREKRNELKDMEDHIAEANAQAEKIIEDARAQAETILAEAREAGEQEKEAVFEQARSEGYAQGLEEVKAQKEEARAELEDLKEQYRKEYEEQVSNLEPAFVELIVKYIRKLTGIYADDKREIILHLIDNAMKDKHGSDNFIIRVSEADFAMASYTKDSIRGYLSDDATVEVVADKLLSKNQCMIETESRIFDCSLDGQMFSLIEDIRMLAEKD